MEIPIDVYRNQVASYMTLEDLFKQRLLGNIAEDIFIEEFLKRIPRQKLELSMNPYTDEVTVFLQNYGNHPYIVNLISIIDRANGDVQGLIDNMTWKRFIDFIIEGNVTLQKTRINTPAWLNIQSFRKLFKRSLAKENDNLFHFLAHQPNYIPYFINELDDTNPFIEASNHISNTTDNVDSDLIYTLMRNMTTEDVPIYEDDLIDYLRHVVSATMPPLSIQETLIIDNSDNIYDIIDVLVKYDLVDDNRIDILTNVLLNL
ncbi:hypothetical protein D3C87_968770 [compost metagenome]